MKNAKCTVDANEFRQALEKALKAAAKKSRIPFLLEALVTFDGGTCTLTCTDLETWCQVSIPAQAEPCSFMLVNSGKLLTACKYFSGELEFAYLEDQPPESAPQKTNLDGTLTLSCGSKELRQRVAAALDFPVMPEVEAEYTYSVDPAALSKRFERIKYALSDHEARPCSQCVKFFDNRIGAVDGYRMALNRDESLCVDAPFHIPPGAMKLLPVFDGAECRLSVGEKHAVFDSGAVRILTRMPEGEGLNFDAAVPKTYMEEHTMDIPDFVGSLRYLTEFIRHPEREAVRFDNGMLSVATVTGEYRSRLELSDPSPTVIGFQGRYMLDGLKQFQAKKLETVTMQMSSPYAPIVLTDQDDIALILPVRLKNAA